MALLDFDATQVEDDVSFDVIPAGKYVMVITDSQMKLTKAGDGEYLELTAEIIEGEHKGRRVWHRINRKNKNPKAVAIGDRTLKSICVATGVMRPHDSSDLHMRPFVANVVVNPAQGPYSATNEIKAFVGKASLPASAASIAEKQAQQAATDPWKEF